jgi:predicted dinucleotide-binding enzyme
MKTALIGLGHVGKQLAKNLIAGNVSIIVSDHGAGRADAFAKGSEGRAEAATVDAAIAKSDILILAIHFDAIERFLSAHAESLAGKIIVDPSNPIAPDGHGGFKKIISEHQSSGQILAALLPEGAKLVKAFGTLSAESLGSAARRSPKRAALFYASDDEAAGEAVATLISASGFDPVNVGGIKESIRIEVFGDLHQFGSLGRVVTAEEGDALACGVPLAALRSHA